MIGYAPAPTDPQRPEPGMASLRVFRFTPRALSLVWQTSPGLLVLLIALTMVAGVLPAGIAYVGARIVDAVVAAIALVQPGGHPSLSLSQPVLVWVVLEWLLVAASSGVTRLTSLDWNSGVSGERVVRRVELRG